MHSDADIKYPSTNSNPISRYSVETVEKGRARKYRAIHRRGLFICRRRVGSLLRTQRQYNFFSPLRRSFEHVCSSLFALGSGHARPEMTPVTPQNRTDIFPSVCTSKDDAKKPLTCQICHGCGILIFIYAIVIFIIIPRK